VCRHSISEFCSSFLVARKHGTNLYNSTDVNFIATQALARSKEVQTNGDGASLDEKVDAMAALERQARAPSGFVPASTGPEGGNIKPAAGNQSAEKNSDEIDLGDDEDL
jgi:pre-mRNA-splicing factor SYF1